MTLILASTSKIRRQLLTNAGVIFDVWPPDVDEAGIKIRHRACSAEDLAMKLAEEKSLSINAPDSGDVVIGADQVLALDEKIYDKPPNVAIARQQLLELRGKTHRLISAICCSKGRKVIWRHTGIATLKVRNFSDKFLDQYLDRTHRDITMSVGGYKLEERGIQLFDTIEGDYFTILGLPLLPLLEFLRRRKNLES